MGEFPVTATMMLPKFFHFTEELNFYSPRLSLNLPVLTVYSDSYIIVDLF